MELSCRLSENIAYIKQAIPLEASFDLISRELSLGDTKAFFLGVNGLCRTDLLQRIFADLQNPLYMLDSRIEDIAGYVSSRIGYAQVSLCDSLDTLLGNVLCGPVALLVDGFSQAILIDVRTYPARGIAEPDSERVSRGSRDGFVETLLLNANLIRRRIRSPRLCFSMHSVGSGSRTDVAIAYLTDSVNQGLLKKLSRAIDSLQVSALTMGAKSLEELLVPKSRFHPLPSIQMTERPDVACSYLLEGHLLVLVDNSPLVLIFPCTIFQFLQNPEDYCKSPSTGSYFRLVRFLCLPVSLLLLPLFLLLTSRFPEFAARWSLLSTPDATPERIFFYVLTVEFLLDLFKYSSSLSPGRLSGSLSMIGGLIIGDIAVDLSWLSVEVLFYGAITLLASLSVSDTEFGDALRLYRVLLILSTGFFGLPGFILSLLLVLLSAATTPTFGGFSYFWPLFPFNRKALGRLLFRSPTPKVQPDTIWNRGNVR